MLNACWSTFDKNYHEINKSHHIHKMKNIDNFQLEME